MLFTLRESVTIRAPLERCFDLSRSVEIVAQELRMKPVSGRTTGLVEANDTVRWEGWKFGLPHHHTSLIDRFEPCKYFRDRMILGRFRTFEHDHFFEQRPNGVALYDELRFSLPFGFPGWLAGELIVAPYIRRTMRQRFALLKRLAETDAWRRYLEGATAAN